MTSLWHDQTGRRLLLLDLCAVILFPLTVLWYAAAGSIDGAWINNLIMVASIALMVLVTWTLIHSCRLRTPQGTLTSWKRIGLYAIAIWVASIVMGIFAATLHNTFVGPLRVGGVISNYSVALTAAVVWFPIWTVVNAIRGRRRSSDSPVE